VDFLPHKKKEKNMFALSRSVAAQTATLASVRLFASRLYFVLFVLPIVVKVFISVRAPAHLFLR
jgi:hypothetical protein